MTLKLTHTLGTGLALTAIAAGALAVATAAPPIKSFNPLRVSVISLGGDKVEVTITNTSRKNVRLPKWQLPSEVQRSNLFRITRDGQEVGFEGAMVKRGVPTAEDFAILRPGRSHRSVVALGSAYDLSKAGHYTVTYAAALQYASLSGGARLQQKNGFPMVAQGAPIRMTLDQPATLPSGGRLRPVLPSNPELSDVLGVSYTACTATQQTALDKAVLSARTYTERAKGYLNAGTTGARYTTWFGAYANTRYATAQQHFMAIDTAMDQTGGQVTINCGCSQNYYAYVYKNLPYEIFVCNSFWTAPLIGTDSRAGTLIHEMSHFTIVADTEDWVYGQSAASNLAATNPTNAVDNADNHEYFSENTPAQN
ncbi:MAG: protease [Xanthomonadales bacterium]|nr:protease [Xanthomonadales bacterium]